MKSPKKTERIELRLSKEDCDVIRDRMEETGIGNRSFYLREMAVNGYIIHVEIDGVKDMCQLLSRYGNNINQIAKRANETGAVYPSDISGIKNQMGEMLSLMRKILEKVSDIM